MTIIPAPRSSTSAHARPRVAGEPAQNPGQVSAGTPDAPPQGHLAPRTAGHDERESVVEPDHRVCAVPGHVGELGIVPVGRPG